ncbi:MAG: hypothetical protein A2508_10710 [Candidatus Lambdaproteobacteria bacterium RIFOXYD12_FULL_49_8]|uniref:Uncharacterized protein n=1 Tax=Candidatus Lambdaproteobacteria bacterium RIFOXYD2_FULL_50_16 TaxID=1817772 RepID=A0A1F6G4S8_9PROT|nr:MAG: hypothetical protein A2527_14415 [Candidatus Lambdaproteobacteria bacterium RIFOXYD2_FULL_50_16]OGG98351.1 MAG: hypothetical protein A2508_10710 [Candidatus Lambdaproteobacteria bacterium RIFOXYD12_FULL_49_8]
MSSTLLIRWQKLEDSGPQLDFWVTNGFTHPVMVLGLVLGNHGDFYPLALEAFAKGVDGYGLSFKIEAFETVRCRPIFDPLLEEALTYDQSLFCFLAHEPWPIEVKPIELFQKAGNLLDRHAFEQMGKGPAR